GATGAARYVSKGLTRSRTDKLGVIPGGAREAGAVSPSPAGGGSDREAVRGGVASNVTAFGGRAEVSGTAALKAEPERALSPTEQLEQSALPFAKPDARAGSFVDARADARAIAAERRAEAKAKGYEGEMCGECLNFT